MINQHFYIARLIARYLSDEIGDTAEHNPKRSILKRIPPGQSVGRDAFGRLPKAGRERQTAMAKLIPNDIQAYVFSFSVSIPPSKKQIYCSIPVNRILIFLSLYMLCSLQQRQMGIPI